VEPEQSVGWHLHVICAVVLAGFVYLAGHTQERLSPPGQIAPRAPVQIMLENAAPIQVGDVKLTPRARFSLEARVLSRERYYLGSAAALMPIDIAFGWADMSDSTLIGKLSISQSMRFYYWGYPGEPPVAPEVIIRSSANMHLIPQTAEVKSVLLSARVGDVVILEGDLVDVRKGDDWWINTSLTREDSGAGACEIIYVRSASIRP
jgi:hypothetical protein